MEYNVLDHGDGNGFTTVFDNSADIEFINPIAYQHQLFGNLKLAEITERFPQLILNHSNDVLSAVQQEWLLYRAEIEKTDVPEAFVKLLDASTKDEQERLLKAQTLTAQQLVAFSFKAWDMGFKYSSYLRTRYPKNFNKAELPRLAYQLREGRVIAIGDTNLSSDELKRIMSQRKVITSFFFDRGKEWHCIFGTYRSIYQGEKAHKGGQAHFHYLSDKYGMSREYVLERFTKGKYPTTRVHIDLLGYGNQP